MKHFILFLLIVVFACVTANAQMNVGSSQAPDNSAMLQVSGNTKGFLPPRMTRDTMLLILNPATGLLVFNTTDSLLYMRRDTGWVALSAGDQYWQKNGTAIYNGNTGFVGIGTNNPSTLLHVEGANPLTLLGVADGTNTSTDSILTITDGLVRKLPLSSFALASDGLTSATAPLNYSGGVISIDQASTTTDGYLSASDYNIFNNKVSSISLTAGTLYPTTSFVINGGAATATLNLNTQAKNKVFAGPVSGANAQPTFRSLVGADLPIATTTATTGLGVISVGSGLSVTPGGVLSVTTPSSGGSVTSASVVTANGLAGTVANPTTTPAITLTTTVTGMVKGNGTALSAATSGTDYAPGTAANATGIVKSTTGTGALTTAAASDFPTLNQNTTGTASNITGVLNATSHPALIGDVTTASGSVATTISNSAVTNTKMANMAAKTFKANNTSSATAPTDITGTQATALLDSFTTSAKGLVPASGGGTTNFLRADGTFAVPPGTNTNAGTVTSVSVTSANGVSGTVATNTTTPAISLTLGAITPSSVAATGTVTGSNLSGTNTGDETNATIKTKLGTASATTDGYLTQTDWNTFNNKQSSITNLGDTAKYLKKTDSSTYTSLYQNSLKQNLVTLTTTGTGAATFNQSTGALNIPAPAAGATYYNTNAGSGNRLAIPNTNQIKSVFATAPLTADSTTNTNALTFGITQAGASSNGYLSSADWNSFNSKATTTNTWSTIGNLGINSAVNFLGTSDNKSLRFRTNNVQRMIADSIGNVAIGTDTFDATNPERFLINAGNTSSVNGLVAKGTINNYFQMNIKNLSSGANATSDIVATADNGTESTNFVDLGINGSGYTGSAIQTGVANDGYLISSGNDFYMVNSSANKNMLFLTGGTGVANERMRILANGRVGMGVQDPTAPFVVKDTMEVRRVGSLSQLLFTNTAGTGDFRIGGDGGDLFWQGGGGRSLQMGSYWTTILTGDRQTSAYPAFISALANTGVLVLGQRDASVPLGVQANSGSQSANLTEWRNSSGTVLSAVTKDGNFGIGISNPSTKLHIVGTNPLTLNGVQTGANTDSILTIINGTVKKLSPSALTVSSSNAWGLTGNTNTLSNNYFLGTTNSDPLIFKVNSQIAGRLDASNTYLGNGSGYNNGTTANQNTGIGYQSLSSNTSGTYNTAIGYNSLQGNVSGSNNIGVGYGAAVANNSSNSIAIGVSSYINNASSIAIGTSAQTNNTSALAIGNYTYVNGQNAIAIGNGTSSIKTQGYGNYSVALGYNGYAGGTNSIAIGSATNVTQANAISIGNASSATAANSVAIGYNAAATTDNTIVLGDKSNAAVSVAIGSENFSASPNREKLLVDATTIGSFNVISARGNLNNYLQLNVQNKNGGANASSDLVATTDNGDENNNYVDLGINSSGNTSGLWGAAGDAYLYTQTNNMLIGTAGNSKVLAFLTGGGTQSSNERMRIDGSGNVGIGTNAPSTKLHIVGTNPLTLSGVQTGTNADSVLTISNGVVKRLSAAALNVSGTSWSLSGNSNTLSSNYFLGTTNTDPLIFKVNNQLTARLDTSNAFMGYQSGSSNGASFTQSTGIGFHALYANSSGTYNTAIGYNSLYSNASGSGNIGVGYKANVANNSSNGIAIGANSIANNDNSIAIGASGYANNASAIAIGNNTNASGIFAVAIGSGSSSTKARALGDTSVALGYDAYSGANNAIAIGKSSKGIVANATALGAFASATGANATVIGASASSPGTNSTAIGYNASAQADNTIVLGDKANTALSVGIGSEAFSSGNREKLLVDAGTSGNTNFQNVIVGKGNTNSYAQLNIQNSNAGTAASSDVVATADNGSESANYIDMGINSSANTANYFGGVNDAYLYATGNGAGNFGGNLLIGTATPSKDIYFLTGGGTKASGVTLNNERMRILGNGNIGMGVIAPAAVLHLKAGTANNAPFKLTAGTNLTTPEDGAVEYDGTNYFATQGTTRYTLAKTFTNTATLDFPSTAVGSASTLTITVTGAADGDAVSLGVPNAAISGITGVFSAYVSAANTVTVKFISAGGTVDPPSGTFRVSILKY